MIFKLLVLCTLMCSVFAGVQSDVTDVTDRLRVLATREIAKAVSDVIFRKFAENKLKSDRKNFIDTYPAETLLQTSDNCERGYDMSAHDAFFVQALRDLSKLVDSNPGKNVRAAYFGCGIGTTSLLLTLTGAAVLGIEKHMTPAEHDKCGKLFHQYTALARRLGMPLKVLLKLSTDATTIPDNVEYSPNNGFSMIFMGNFLHMFDPATARDLVQQQAYRMLEQKGFVYATADGIAIGETNEHTRMPTGRYKEFYLKAKRSGVRFPSVMTETSYGIMLQDEGGRNVIQKTNLTPTLSSAATDES